MFRIALPTLSTTIDEYAAAFRIIETELQNTDQAIMTLSRSGWSGNAQAAFYEKFFLWIQRLSKFYERLAFIGNILEAASIQAEVLKQQAELLPSELCPTRNFSRTSSGRGDAFHNVIFQPTINLNVTQIKSMEFPQMKTQLAGAMALSNAMLFRPFPIGGNLSRLISQINQETSNFRSFSNEYRAFSSNVDTFETETSQRLSFAGGDEFNLNEANSFFGHFNPLDLYDDGLVRMGTVAGLRTAFRVPSGLNMRVDGNLLRLSGPGFRVGSGLSSQYTLSRLAVTNPQVNAWHRIDRLSRSGAFRVAGHVLIIGNGVLTGYNEFNRNPYLPTERRVINAVVHCAVDIGIGYGAVAVGAKIGGALGTLIPIPVVGTLIGIAVGVGVGMGVNWLLNQDWNWLGGRSVMNHITDGVNAAWDGVRSGARRAWNWVTGRGSRGTVEPSAPPNVGARAYG